MYFPRLLKPKYGFSLLEVIISITLLVLISVSIITSLMFSYRITRVNTNAIAAKNIAQGFFEKMAIDTFANVGPVHYATIAYDNETPVWLDEAMNMSCRVEFAFKGFGTTEGGSLSSLIDNDTNWETNEWAGDTVYLVEGKGIGHFAPIISNSINTLHLGDTLTASPDTTTKYMINNGKTVEITTTWEYYGKSYSQTIESLIVNYRGDSNLGF